MFLANHSSILKKKLYDKYGEEEVKTNMPDSFTLKKVIDRRDESRDDEVKLTRLQIQMNEAEEKVKKRKIGYEHKKKILQSLLQK